METPLETAVGSATLAHVMPGRIRLKLQSVRGDEERAAAVEETLLGLEIVEDVVTNPRSGSVIVEYSPELEASEALGQIAAALDVEIEERSPGGPASALTTLNRDSGQLAERVREVFRETNAKIAGATGGIDLRVLVPGALLCLGIGSFLGARQRRMPAWHDLIWYAFNTFETLNRRRTEDEDFTPR